jgi:hypothetical protein
MKTIVAALGMIAAALGVEARAQLVWNQEMKEYSAVLPLTLDEDVYRIRAKPPADVSVQDIICDIGITGTVLTDKRGTSGTDDGEKVASVLMEHDDIDVYFTDRVNTGNRDFNGNRIIQKYDLDCGINIKYQTKLKVAQVEIRLGYILPSGDIEGLTWAKLKRKQRIYRRNIAKCGIAKREIAELEKQCIYLASAGGNNVDQTLNAAKLASLNRTIERKQRFTSREDEFRRDLAAFLSLNEYLKTKVNGCQVYVHFHYDGKTLPADIAELKRHHIRPIQVFDVASDPILNRQ